MGEVSTERKPRRSSATGAAGNLAAYALALARDVVLAAMFRRDETDEFFIAFTIPNVLRQVLAEGATSGAVASVLAKRVASEGEDAARSLFQRLRGGIVVVLALATLAGVLLARPLTLLVAGGLQDRPGVFDRTVALTRTAFPYLLLAGIAALGSAALYVKRKRAAVAFAPMIPNLSFVVAALALPAVLDAHGVDRAQALVAGALVGGTLHIVVQHRALPRAGWTGPAIVDFREPALRDIARRVAPVGLGVLVYAVDLVLSRRFLSDFGPGAQSWFAWAMRLCDFPQQLCVLAVTIVGAASLGRARGADDVQKAAANGMRLTLFLTVPASLALVVIARPIVALVFERGEFDANSTWETSRALVWQASALWAVALSRRAAAVLYAMRDSRTPLVASAVDVAMFVGIALGLRGRMGHVAISAALAGSSLAQALTLLPVALRKMPAGGASAILVAALRTVAAAVPAALAAGFAAQWLAAPEQAGAVARALPGGAALAAFAVVYLAGSWLLRSPELAALIASARKRRS